MAETIISQLDRAFDKPLETNRQVNFISDRDAISALRRWQGMQVFVISEQKTYTLKTGILNTDWVESEAASLTGYTEQGGYTGTAQDIVDSIETVTSGIEIISITHIANLDYYVVADPYKINSEYYSAAPTTITLDVGDATNARIDVIYADVDGLIGVLAGTPSATPVKPIVSNTQRELTFRTVPALATVDPIVTNELVFDENVGVVGGEFDVDGWNLTALNFNSATVAFSGTKSIYFDGVDAAFNVDFKNDANIAVSGLSSFYFRVYVTEVLDRNASFFFHCLDTSFVATGSNRTVKDGLFGFDRNVLNVWQLVSIPIAFFNLPVAEIKGIRFMVSSIKKPKMYIDTMAFQYNVTQPDLTPTIYELTSNKKTDIEANKTSNIFYAPIKAIYDWGVSIFQRKLIAGTNITIDETDPLNPIINASGGGETGDMLASTYDPNTKNADAFAMDNFDVATVEKATPIDADRLNLWDSVTSTFKYLTLTNLKAFLSTYFQIKLVAGTNITIDNTDTNAPIINASGGGGTGDMVLADVQTVTGLKTFLAGKFGLRNVANTFTSFFTNANTAARTYTLQNRNGILADNTDLATKMNNPTGGIVNYLPKFLTATTMGLSRLWDTGAFFGIGTLNTPLKDITLGNQANREIGIEASSSTTNGKDLVVSAGKTVNYQLNANFQVITPSVGFASYGMAASPSNNIYAVSYSLLYKQTNGQGTFINTGLISGNTQAVAVTPTNDVYVALTNGSIYKQTAEAGAMVNLSQTSRNWFGMCAAPNGNVYASVMNGDIYMQTAGVGNFIALGQTTRAWARMASAPNGDIFCIASGVIYKQTNGVGDFAPYSGVQSFTSLTITANNNLYAGVDANVFLQTNLTGLFVNLNQAIVQAWGMAATPNGVIYVGDYGDNIYTLETASLGTANLDGGTLIQKAGTGKGTGKSRYEIWTGQKTASGTDMQLETLRFYIDENGYTVYPTMPTYADNASALAAGLVVGTQYRTATGVSMIVY